MKAFLAIFTLHFWQQGSTQQRILVSVVTLILIVVIVAAIFNAVKARMHQLDKRKAYGRDL
jgi:hypothetical protein